MRIVDIHTHLYNEARYQSYLKKSKQQIAKIITIHHWLEVLPDNKTADVDLDKLLSFANSKKNLFVIGSVNFSHDIAIQLKKLELTLKQNKIVGIKLYPGYQPFYPSDKTVWPIAQLCQKYNRPLIFHSGDFYNFEGGAVLKYSDSIFVDELAVKFPKCKIIIAHFSFPKILETANIVYKNENVYTDISATIDKNPPLETVRLARQYAVDLKRALAYFPNIKDKIMFGTDYAGEHTILNQVEPYIKMVKQLFSKEGQ